MKAELSSGKDTQVSMWNDSTLLLTFGARGLLLVATSAPFPSLTHSLSPAPQSLNV